MTRNQWNVIAEELFAGSLRIIETIVDLRARDEFPETVARAAGLEFDRLKERMEDLTSEAE